MVTAIIAATGTPIIAVVTVIIMATIITMIPGVASVSSVVTRVSGVAVISLRVVLSSMVTTASTGAALPGLSILERDEDEGGGNATDEPLLEGHEFTPRPGQVFGRQLVRTTLKIR